MIMRLSAVICLVRGFPFICFIEWLRWLDSDYVHAQGRVPSHRTPNPWSLHSHIRRTRVAGCGRSILANQGASATALGEVWVALFLELRLMHRVVIFVASCDWEVGGVDLTRVVIVYYFLQRQFILGSLNKVKVDGGCWFGLALLLDGLVDSGSVREEFISFWGVVVVDGRFLCGTGWARLTEIFFIICFCLL